MPLFALLFLIVPAVEIYLIVQASHSFGFGNTLGALIVIAVLGSWLIKREGTKVWTRFITQVNQGKVPSEEIADGVCLMFAGALMLTPGFLTDVVALVLLFPPTRALVRRVLVRRYSGQGRVVRATYGPRQPGAATGSGPIDTTATDTTGTNGSGEPPSGQTPSGQLGS